MRLSDDRLGEIAVELATKPKHEKVRALLYELLTAGLGTAGVEAEQIAVKVPIPDDLHFQTARRRVREALVQAGISKRIDALVAKVLDG